MKKLTLKELSNKKDWKDAVIVIDNSSFTRNYPLESRSYKVSSNDNYFDSSKISKSLYGTSLDNVDLNIRLDLYMWEQNWKVEYCYILN
jgi:hypothetical protein